MDLRKEKPAADTPPTLAWEEEVHLPSQNQAQDPPLELMAYMPKPFPGMSEEQLKKIMHGRPKGALAELLEERTLHRSHKNHEN